MIYDLPSYIINHLNLHKCDWLQIAAEPPQNGLGKLGLNIERSQVCLPSIRTAALSLACTSRPLSSIYQYSNLSGGLETVCGIDGSWSLGGIDILGKSGTLKWNIWDLNIVDTGNFECVYWKQKSLQYFFNKQPYQSPIL